MSTTPSNSGARSASSKYQELARHLRLQIHSGMLRPGDRLPTLAAMREAHSASRPTVEKAYAMLAAEGLVERQHSMSAVVASPSSQKVASGVLGLCGFQGIGSSPYWKDLVDGINFRAQAVGAQILLLPYMVGEGWEKVDGVLICDWLNAYYMQSIPSQLPVVSLFVSQEKWGRPSVVADEYNGVRQAMEHLLSLGHRKIAYLHGQDEKALQPRFYAYDDALREAGIECQPEWCRSLRGKNDFGPQFIASGRRDMNDWLTGKGASRWESTGCTALLCHNDEAAIGAMQAMQEFGLKVPQDVSVLGFDGTAAGEYASPHLTSVALPLRQMGEVSVDLLRQQIASDEGVVESRTLCTKLIVRDSTTVCRLRA